MAGNKKKAQPHKELAESLQASSSDFTDNCPCSVRERKSLLHDYSIMNSVYGCDDHWVKSKCIYSRMYDTKRNFPVGCPIKVACMHTLLVGILILKIQHMREFSSDNQLEKPCKKHSYHLLVESVESVKGTKRRQFSF